MARVRLAHRSAFLSGFAVVGVALLLAGAATWWAVFGAGGGEPRCTDRIPVGRSISAAWTTTELFVADVLLGGSPVCGYELSTERLRGGRSQADWASGRAPVRGFPTHLPAVPILRASRDRDAREAVYVLSRRTAAFVVVGAGGRPEIPMIAGVAAPDAGRGAYNLVLVVEHGSWRVDRVRRVAIRDSG